MFKYLAVIAVMLSTFSSPVIANDVRITQELLTELGYNPGPIDGAWGSKTETALTHLLTKFGKPIVNDISNETVKIVSQIAAKISNPAFKVFNDFSRGLYRSGIIIQPSGRHPKAASINDGILSINVTPKMYATYSKSIQRFEIGKSKIPPHLAAMLRFKIRSNNKVSDRTMIAQIKFHKYDSGGGSPIAAVYIDRPPQCVTYTKKVNYPMKRDTYIMNPFGSLPRFLWVYAERHRSGELINSNWIDKQNHGTNQSYTPLNDGKWHEVEMHVYPHKSKGFCRVYIDGQLKLNVSNASTKSYHFGKHSDYAARIGIYRDGVNYDQKVEFDDYEVIGYRP